MEQESTDSWGNRKYRYRECELPPFVHIIPIGHGGVGTVDEVEDVHHEDKRYARKSIVLSGSAQERKSTVAKIKEAVKIVQSTHHEHVIRFIGTYSKEDRSRKIQAIIMEPVADTDLEQYLLFTRGRKNREQILQWFSCLVNGLAYLHSKGIRHMDIKPQNILIHNSRVFFTDIGITTIDLAQMTLSESASNAHFRYSAYSAPEVKKGVPNGPPADIFSLGAVFLEMVVACCNANKLPDLRDALVSENFLSSYSQNTTKALEFGRKLASGQPLVISQLLLLCQEMMSTGPDERPDINALQLCWSYCPWTALTDFSCDCNPEPTPCGRDIESADAALYEAARNGLAVVARLLIQRGANAHRQMGGKGTALHAAAGSGHVHTVRVLLIRNANINQKDTWGATPLHYAAANGKADVIRFLVLRGANKNAQDKTMTKPLVYAMRNGHGELEDLLTTYNQGSKPRTETKVVKPGPRGNHVQEPQGSCTHSVYCTLEYTSYCCACNDKRPMAKKYETYVDGSGIVHKAKRWEHYCPPCREYFSLPDAQFIPQAPQEFSSNTGDEGSMEGPRPHMEPYDMGSYDEGASRPRAENKRPPSPYAGGSYDQGASTLPEKRPKYNETPQTSCQHKLTIPCERGNIPCCCSCADTRYVPDFYESVDIFGKPQKTTRWAGYCLPCQGHFGTCEHKRSIPCTSPSRWCCACSDIRAPSQPYLVMPGGRMSSSTNKWENYCSSCQEHERRSLHPGGFSKFKREVKDWFGR